MSQIANRYARAFYELATERNLVAPLSSQLRQLDELLQKSEVFRNTMLNPSLSLEERKQVLRTIGQKFAWDTLMVNFCLLLLDKNRFMFASEIQAAFQRSADQAAGLVRANVTSAKPLNMMQQAQIKRALSSLHDGATVELETDVDPELIGGVVTRVDGKVYDGSVRTQLERLRSSILSEI